MARVEHKLAGKTRGEIGSAAGRRFRRAGRVPCVVYGAGQPPVALTVERADVIGLLKHPWIVQLDIDGQASKNVLVQDVQWDYLANQLLHVDFREIRMDQKLRTAVPLVAVGRPVGADKGGILEQMAFDIQVECLPADLPEKVEMDVTHLDLGKHVTVSELKVPATVRVVYTNPKQVVAHVFLPRAIEEVTKVAAEGEVAAVEGAEGAEGAAAGAEGAAPAGEGKEGAAPAAGGKDAAKGGKDAAKGGKDAAKGGKDAAKGGKGKPGKE